MKKKRGIPVTEGQKQKGSVGLPDWCRCQIWGYYAWYSHTHTQGEAHTHLHLFSISGWTNKQLRHAGLPGRFSCQAFVYPPFSVSGSFLLARAPLCTHTESCLYHFRGHNINSHLFSGEFCLSQSYPESKHWALQQFGVNSRSRANTDTSVKYSAIAEI